MAYKSRRSLHARQTRRQWLASTGGALASLPLAGWLNNLAWATGEAKPHRSCILLWMNGGASQTDTFDMKPDHENGGPFKPIATATPGIQISEHLPQLAQWTNELAIVRSMSTREGDHGRARDHMRTGYMPMASIEFPVLGSLVSHQRGPQTGDLPNYVSIFAQGLFGPGTPPAGYLGPDYAPLLVGRDFDGDEGQKLTVENLSLPGGVSKSTAARRLELLQQMQQGFLGDHPGAAVDAHTSAFAKAARLMSPEAAKAFNLDEEAKGTLERYGRSQFGQGCLLARRLVERGVPFVEVSQGGWDTHDDNFPRVRGLSAALDRPFAALISDLKERGLLESTLIVWMGEFGRTPGVNPRRGRDHFPKAWTVVLGGAGIQGGAVVGRTSADGMNVEERPVSAPDLLATIFTALKLDPRKQNPSNVGRPIRLADPNANPIKEILA